MTKLILFISSVQSEFAVERDRLWQHLKTDAMLSEFFEPVMFEKLPANVQAPNKVYLDEVARSQVYLVLAGQLYGYEDENGVSPTEHEFDQATKLQLSRLAFLKGNPALDRHPKEAMFIGKIQNDVTYKRFENTEELLSEVSRALIQLLKDKGLIQFRSFDDSLHPFSGIPDIDPEKIEMFVSVARSRRGFPVRLGTSMGKVLAHLNLLQDNQLINSALLVFAFKPQHFFPAAIVKCAHFHGLDVVKPIPDHKVFQGDVFEQVDQAVDFVMSKINLSVGTRDESNQAPVMYEIPRAAVAEAIVNAVAHRDYQSNGSVQVMLFSNRLEVSNPGRLAPELSITKLKIEHSSYPTNPRLAECLYQAGYIERFGTGTGEIFRLSREAGLIEPIIDLEEGFRVILWRPNATWSQVPDKYKGLLRSSVQVTDQVTGQAAGQAAGQVTGQVTGQATGQVEEGIRRVILVIFGNMKSSEIQDALGLKHREYFRDNYLIPSMNEGYLEMTIPDKPNSPNQQYRLTVKGQELKKRLEARQ